ncbi:DUF2236 domain-containing protein [Pseudenhygromyxa sp. WMMC2535]|uniref:oxygenase MpaB family protein n=1 Tax=Pseudenhygromyxa sp. WMMC2535 TaxID=2712867 RepID=UPI00155481AF|nr:DUF2236 domain-containing protein [Pseudenhygromyxa sp. WMMC2535]
MQQRSRNGTQRPEFDFARPAGAAALYSADSITWRVYKNPISLFIGGITAVLLELAEPRVRTGVWEHSIFPRDPLARMRRTGMAAQVTVYAPAQTAERVIASVVRMHERVEGRTPEGVGYRANDQVLLDWVQATASFGFLEAYARFARPLRDLERDRYYAESRASARLFGAEGAPRSLAEQRACFANMRPMLVAHPIIVEFLELVDATPVFPKPLRWLQSEMIRAGVDLLPEGLAAELELESRWALDARARKRLARIGAAADRLPIPKTPAVQACRRMGVPLRRLYL